MPDPEREERRVKIFDKLPSLVYLDGLDCTGKPEEENDEDDEEDEDEDDEEENGILNGIAGDDELDDEDEGDEEDEDDDEEYENGTGHYNGDINGHHEYQDQSSDAEDEQDDDDDDSDEDDHEDLPPVRGKKRKFDEEGLP